MQKMIFALALVIAGAASASAQLYGSTPNNGLYGTGSNPNSHYVSPYTTQSGRDVAPHYQTNPNNTQLDNYGTRGNLNPYTGQFGTRSPRY